MPREAQEEGSGSCFRIPLALAARTLDPLNLEPSGISFRFIKDIGAVFRSLESAVGGVLAGSEPRNNPIKEGLHFQELLDSGQVDSQTELSLDQMTPRSIERYVSGRGNQDGLSDATLNPYLVALRVLFRVANRLGQLAGRLLPLLTTPTLFAGPSQAGPRRCPSSRGGKHPTKERSRPCNR